MIQGHFVNASSRLEAPRQLVAEIHLFDTCTYKCAYCHFAESGKVLDASQLRPYRDTAFIDQIASFFLTRTTKTQSWLLTLTGGEPLLMPNLDRFCNAIGTAGNRVAFYTAMLIGESHPSFRYLLRDAGKVVDYLMVSFHAEAEEIEEEFFRRLGQLKAGGHNVILRFVGHPDRLNRLNELAARCQDLDIAFHPTPLFSPEYPPAYTKEQRAMLAAHAVSHSQVIQLENGVETSNTRCTAGSDLIAIDMRTGNITPCITVGKPLLGNIYDNRLDLFTAPTRCPAAGVSCICDIHFQQNVVAGADDRENFEKEKRGYVQPKDYVALKEELLNNNLKFSEARPAIGQTKTAGFRALSKAEVKSIYERNVHYYKNEYAAANHPAFLTRQFGESTPPPETKSRRT